MTLSAPEISLIVPALNEEENIPELVAKLQRALAAYGLQAEILLVDDCSDDNTFRVACDLEKRSSCVRAVHKGLPRGMGGAIRTGIEHARGKMGVVVMADGVDPLEALPQMYQKVMHEGYHLALLSRYRAPEDSATIPPMYRFFHRGFRVLMFLLIGIPFKDTTYAYRAFDLDFVRALNLESTGFEISPEVTLKTWLKKGRIAEVKGSQGRRVRGRSKFYFMRVARGYTRVLVKGFLMRVSGRWW